MPPMAPEVGIIRTYVDWILDLPWTKSTPDNLDVKHAARILDRDHYGLKKAKERILEYIAVRSLKPKKERQPILCFVGPPGTGKTSLGRSIAEALGRKFVRVSLGGVRDEAEIRGHRRTYIGALARTHPANHEARRELPIRSSCWMRSTSSIPIFAATRPRPCWKCSTPNKIIRSAIIILNAL
jgi:hypothetical protein